MKFIYILILILIIIYINCVNLYDKFTIYPVHQTYIPMFNNYTKHFIWTPFYGQTKNMSYDLRGDPIIIQRQHLIFNN